MTSFEPSEWASILEHGKFANESDDTSGTELLSSDVPEERVLIPLAFLISDTSGAANTADFQKVEEDDTTTALHTNFNLGANETVILEPAEFATVIPRLEGDSNIQFTAGSDGVEVTMLYVYSTEV